MGLGATAGLILGFLAGLLGLMFLSRGSGRSIEVAGRSWSSDVRFAEPSEQVLIALHASMEVMGVDLGAIERVVPVLARSRAAGLELTLVAVEWREAGLVCWIDGATRPGGEMPAHTMDVTATDDRSTAYRAAGEAQGGRRGMRFEVVVIPRPPADARRLVLRIDRFVDPFPPAARSVAGPWEIALDLVPPVAPEGRGA